MRSGPGDHASGLRGAAGMTAIAPSILAVPPFPGARPHAVVAPSPAAGPATQEAAADLISAMRRHRVGGAFWQADDIWASDAETLRGDADDPGLLLGAIAGKRIDCAAGGRFSGLSGRAPGSAETERRIEALAARHLLDNLAWFDPFTGDASSPLALVETLGAWRRLIDANRPLAAAFGFAHWKRSTVDPLLWAGRPVPFRGATLSALRALHADASIAIWKARVPAAFLTALEAGPWRLVEVEDGFIRSAGLGADCVPPLSIVLDDLGVHYDPARPNQLEAMLAHGLFAPEDLARASALRDWLVREGVSKYGVGGATALPRPGGAQRHLLVVGQVEDDRSVLSGGGAVRTNLTLLRHVRERAPDAWIVYRPHPDVEAGHRRGAIPRQQALELANSIDCASPISALIAMADEVHVVTSLAGFEALLHGKPVTTHGTPFFAGWGLTTDLGDVPARRGHSRSVDELVAAVLLRYPRYLDPVTNLPCTPEMLVMRLVAGVQRQNEALVPLRRMLGWAKRAAAQLVGTR